MILSRTLRVWEEHPTAASLSDLLVALKKCVLGEGEHSSVAYRSMESSVSLDQILCFKHRRKVARDNTVKYNWRTLQLLPGKERPSYAGAQLEVHEGLDGQLLVQYRGRTIPTQEAPPRPGVLRASNGPLRYGPGLERRVNGVGSHPKESLASLDAIEADSATLNGGGRVRKPPASPRRKPVHAATEGPVEGRAAG